MRKKGGKTAACSSCIPAGAVEMSRDSLASPVIAVARKWRRHAACLHRLPGRCRLPFQFQVNSWALVDSEAQLTTTRHA
jgi:hypothetical protein